MELDFSLSNLFSPRCMSAEPSESSSSYSSSSTISFVLSTQPRGDEPTIFVIDTLVATMILDGEACIRSPIESMVTISGLGVAMQHLPPDEKI